MADPYPCPLQDKCWAFLPADSVFNLYYGGKKCWHLLGEGIQRLRDIPDHVDLTDRQAIQRKVALTGQPHIDRNALASFLKRLKHPVGYLDFETFNTAIPPFDGLRPYEQVPFQFSLHRQPAPGANQEHHGFLADGRGDPRPEFVNRLRGCIGDKGAVVVYNAKFEKGVLDALADAFPDHAGWIEKVKGRIIDLLEPFQSFDYYHPEQHGSASIKSVLTGRSYADLEIQEGGQASLEYLRVHFGDVPEAGRRKVRERLERSCGQDTEGWSGLLMRCGSSPAQCKLRPTPFVSQHGRNFCTSFRVRQSPGNTSTGGGLAAILLWSATFAFARSLSEQVGPMTAGAAAYLIGGCLCLARLGWSAKRLTPVSANFPGSTCWAAAPCSFSTPPPSTSLWAWPKTGSNYWKSLW